MQTDNLIAPSGPKLNKIPQNLFLAIILIFSIVTLYAIQRFNHTKITTSPKQVTSNSNPSLKEEPLMEGFQLTESDSGGKIFTMKADKFYLRNKKVPPFNFRVALGKSVEMEGVGLTFYRDDKPVSCIYSLSAAMDAGKKDIVFDGRPALITKGRDRLGADKIIWNNSEKRVYAKGNCVLDAKGKAYSADTINADMELNNFILKNKKQINLREGK